MLGVGLAIREAFGEYYYIRGSTTGAATCKFKHRTEPSRRMAVVSFQIMKFS
jgi:hypothetical protein